MPNDEGWQKRSDEWVKMTHASSARKAKQKEKGNKDEGKMAEASLQKPRPNKGSKK